MADMDATTAAELAFVNAGTWAEARAHLHEFLGAAVAAARPLIVAEAATRERQRIRDGSDHWPGGIAGPAWYKVPADLLDGDDDG